MWLLIIKSSQSPLKTATLTRLCLTGLKISTMCALWKFNAKSTMIGLFATKAKPIKSRLCPNALPPSINALLKRRFQGISPSLTETALSQMLRHSGLSNFKWGLTPSSPSAACAARVDTYAQFFDGVPLSSKKAYHSNPIGS